ncbi:MAG: AbrB/MazE/SpoVT family DNA-binding domain-containing protein [Bacteriovorax sp.]|nr:AbrB/MazE/SpoVT family DNA-binding domain-containing protein [Bacteriovorax sp.]
MSAKIQKWGNSLGIRIPKAIIEKANLDENSEVEIETKDGTIIIFPSKKKQSLSTLLGQITKKNLHKEEEFEVEGNEVW